MKSLMDFQRDNCARYFTGTTIQIADFCGARPRATILRQWHRTICIVKVFLLSEREVSQNYTGIFLDFFHGFSSYVKGLPKTKRCNWLLLRFRFGFGVIHM